jgi:CRISPR-associated protein Csb2
MLQLQIGFPGGRYHAADMADPRQPEWPPHPSRIFSALVAATYAGGRQPSAAEREALQRLEAAPPPALRCPDADVRPAADSYVPVNDVKTRIEAKKGQSSGVLYPNRQVRQFPVAFLLGEPEVLLLWPLDPDPDWLQVLDCIASRVTHVGTSHTFVTARFVRPSDQPQPTLEPSEHGTHYLRVTTAGRLVELDRLADQRHGTLRRPPPACEAMLPYADARSAAPAVDARHDWVALRLTNLAWGADTAHTLARAVRRAVMSLLGDDAPAAVHGHDLAIEHAAWLPLPDVGHPYARGRIRGVAVALPLTMPAQDRAFALAGLARLRCVQLPDGQVAECVAHIDGPDAPLVLRTSTWCEPSAHWSTVTPVLLNKPPKKNDADAILASLAATLVEAGLPEPVSLIATQTSDFAGAPGALDIPTRIPRFHARVVFAAPVAGPVIAGRWRNFGIGLFRPTPKEFR